MSKYKKFEMEEGYYKLKDLPKGEMIRKSPTSSKVYIKGDYDRGAKAFWLDDYSDISRGVLVKGNVKVYAGF
jgi:hypothetical protein